MDLPSEGSSRAAPMASRSTYLSFLEWLNDAEESGRQRLEGHGVKNRTEQERIAAARGRRGRCSNGARPEGAEDYRCAGMPRSTGPPSDVVSIWLILDSAPVRLMRSPSISPSRPCCSASVMRSMRLSRISTRRPRWTGSGRRREQRTQACAVAVAASAQIHAPGGVLAVAPDQVTAWLGPLPIDALHGVGPAGPQRCTTTASRLSACSPPSPPRPSSVCWAGVPARRRRPCPRPRSPSRHPAHPARRRGRAALLPPPHPGRRRRRLPARVRSRWRRRRRRRRRFRRWGRGRRPGRRRG